MAHYCVLFSTQCLGSSSPPLPPPPIKVLVFRRAGVCCVLFCHYQEKRRGRPSPFSAVAAQPNFGSRSAVSGITSRPQSAACPSLLWPSRDSSSAATATTEGTTSQSVIESVSRSVCLPVMQPVRQPGGSATLSLPNKDPQQKKKKKRKEEKLSSASAEEERERRSF